MKSLFIKNMIKSAEKNINITAVVDNGGKAKCTYGSLMVLSLKVAAYLKAANVPSGSFICVHMKKSCAFLACELGIWMSKCVAVPIGDTYPDERVRYIIGHCNAALVLDDSNIGTIANMTPAEPVIPDSKDNALLIYTSGSTGNPKGVLHTFETLDLMDEDSLIPGLDLKNAVYASAAPFTFALAVRAWAVLLSGGQFHILDDSISKSPELLEEYVANYGITVCNISPSVQKFFHNHSEKLKVVFGGGERYTTQYSKEGYTIWSDYGQSETVLGIANYELPDHPMDKVPLGKCNKRYEFQVIDENGKELPPGQIGELILKGTFFKEYFKEPELTAKAVVDGWLHTKDLVYVNDFGELQFVNRKDWMIKINGQRVEPGEIESAMRSISGITDAAVKDFTRDDGSVYICAYYTEDTDHTRSEIRKFLEGRLNSYMIPSFFVKLEEFPTLPNGKLNRNGLIAPDASEFANEYKAPETELQSNICEAIKNTLQISSVGVKDDFFDLGGNSIKCMELCSYLSDHYNIVCPAKLVYSNPTPDTLDKAIDAYNDQKLSSDAEISDDQYPLPYQVYFLDYQLFSPNQCVANNVMFLKMDRDKVDPYKLADALNTAMHHFKNFQSVFKYNDAGELVFHYQDGLLANTPVTETTEERIEAVHKAEFSKPFGLLNCLLHRSHIYATDINTYLFLDIHHAIHDASSQRAFLKAVFDCYNGVQLAEDKYFEFLTNIHNEEISDSEKILEYLTKMQSQYREYDTYPKPDCMSTENIYGNVCINSVYTNGEIEEALKKKNVTMNCAMIAAGLLGISRYNNCKKTGVEWIYSGRDEAWKEDLVGLTIEALPVYVDFDTIPCPDFLLEEVNKQIAYEMKYADLSYAVRYISPCRKESMKVIYELYEGLPDNVPSGSEYYMNFKNLSGSGCIFQCIVAPGEINMPFQLTVTGNAAMYSKQSMKTIGECVLSSLEECIGLSSDFITGSGI